MEYYTVWSDILIVLRSRPSDTCASPGFYWRIPPNPSPIAFRFNANDFIHASLSAAMNIPPDQDSSQTETRECQTCVTLGKTASFETRLVGLIVRLEVIDWVGFGPAFRLVSREHRRDDSNGHRVFLSSVDHQASTLAGRRFHQALYFVHTGCIAIV